MTWRSRPTGVLRRAVDVHHRVRDDGDRGTTLVEVVVAMTIMVICGSIFTGAVYTLSRTSNQAQAITDASSQGNQSFQALDKTVRYAAAISAPGTSPSGSWYVELRDTTSGSEVCTQLRVDRTSSQLQSRTWNATNVATLSTWRPLASGLTNAAATTGPTVPFVVTPQAATAIHQQLTFTTVTAAGPADQRVSSTSSYVLTALNSTLPLPTGPICQQAGRP